MDLTTESDPLISNSNTKQSEYFGHSEKSHCHLYFVLFLLLFFVSSVLFYLYQYIYLPYNNTILFFTDIHIDYEYVYTKSAKTHCHILDKNEKTYFKYGQYGCDTTEYLLTSLYDFFRQKIKKPKLILFGGDASCTWTYNRTSEIVHKNLINITKTLRSIYPNTPIIYNMGNGEYMPNYGSFDTDKSSFLNVYDAIKDTLNEDQKKTFLKGGYYYYDLPETNLRFISFNTPLYSKRRNETDITDPYEQFKWLRNVLNTQKKTILMFHIEPGVSYARWENCWKQKFIDKISEVFSEKAPDFLLGAHTHIDLFMPFFNTKKMNLLAISHAAVSPQHDNNPSFRVYNYNNNGLLDYTQYYFDIKGNPTEPNWEKEYTFSSAYNQKDLSQKSLIAANKWIDTTSKGRWTFLEHIRTRAMPDSAFYQCILKAYNLSAFKECVVSLS